MSSFNFFLPFASVILSAGLAGCDHRSGSADTDTRGGGARTEAISSRDRHPDCVNTADPVLNFICRDPNLARREAQMTESFEAVFSRTLPSSRTSLRKGYEELLQKRSVNCAAAGVAAAARPGATYKVGDPELSNGHRDKAFGYCVEKYAKDLDYYLISFVTEFKGQSRDATFPPLSTPRVWHSTTRLSEGSLLVAGGCKLDEGLETEPGCDSALKSVELYNPVNKTWKPGSTLLKPRAGHRAFLLDDGRILLAGGVEGKKGFVEIYDPKGALNSGIVIDAPPGSHFSKNPVAILLKESLLLVMARDYGSNAWVYSIADRQWKATPAFVKMHGEAFELVALRDGRAMLTNGYFSLNGTAVQANHIYDPRTNRWTTQAKPQTGGGNQTSSLLGDGSVLLAGGMGLQSARMGVSEIFSQAELYMPATDTYRSLPSLYRGRFRHFSISQPDGSVLTLGGDALGRGCSGGDYTLPPIEKFDPRSGIWTVHSALQRELLTGVDTATLMDDGSVVLIGGPENERVSAEQLRIPSAQYQSAGSSLARNLMPYFDGLSQYPDVNRWKTLELGTCSKFLRADGVSGFRIFPAGNPIDPQFSGCVGDVDESIDPFALKDGKKIRYLRISPRSFLVQIEPYSESKGLDDIKHWVQADHLEIWASFHGKLYQWGVMPASGQVIPAFGSPGALMLQTDIARHLGQDGRKVDVPNALFKLTLGFAPEAISLSWSSGDGKHVREVVSTSALEFGKRESLGGPVSESIPCYQEDDRLFLDDRRH